MRAGCGQVKQPVRRKERVGPTLMIATVAATPAVLSSAQDAAQARAEPGVERTEPVPRAVLKVHKPPAQRAIHVRDDDSQRLPIGAAGFGPQGVLELVDALRSRPVMARGNFRDGLPAFHLPGSLCSTPITGVSLLVWTLRLLPDRLFGSLPSMNTVLSPLGQVSLRSEPIPRGHSVATHLIAPHRRVRTLPLSAMHTRLCPCRTSPSVGRLVGHTRPNRVSHPTDWSTTADCSPRRLATAQLPLVSGRRAYA
jgi:hypothetical protein